MKVKRWVLLVGLIATLGLLAFACGNTEPPDGGVDGEIDGGPDSCPVDNSRVRPSIEADWQIIPDGDPATGHICPRSDVDHFWVTIANPGTILSVDLSNNVSMSAIDLCYKILPEDVNAPMIADLCDHDGMDGVTELRGSHYLATAGTYFVEVRDESGDEADARNAYAISLSQVADPDGNELNNDMGSATPLAGSSAGYISYLGDQDWFAISVDSPGQILSIDLAIAEASPVDLRYTLYRSDGTSPVNTGVDTDGMNGATSLADVLSVEQAGTYYLVITDELHDDADLELGYSVSINIQPNPDSRDRNGSNDSPFDATPISSGATISDAYLATRADQDWYKIEAPGVSDVNPAILEIELTIGGASPVDPAVDLIVGDPNTPCNQGDACEVLSWTCGGGSCVSAECRNAQCPSHECLDHENRCRGAGFCLPEGGCGIRHLIMHGADWSTTGSPRALHTVAPMYGSTYYILVRDFIGDDLDPQNAYSLTATVRTENDSHEPNGLYLPYATDEQDRDTRDWNKDRSSSVNCTDEGTHIQCGPISGYLSFRGDQDWYRLNNFPTEDEASPLEQSLKVDYDFQFDWSFAGVNQLFPNYGVFEGSLREAQMGFNHQGPGSGVWGTGAGECSYLCGEYHGSRPLYLRVVHSDRKIWDYNDSYNLTIRAYRTCPLNCEFCQPGADYYPCPNPGNTCPAGDCE